MARRASGPPASPLGLVRTRRVAGAPGPDAGGPAQGQPTVAMRRPAGAEPAGAPRGESRSEAGYPAAQGGYESGSYRRDSSGFPAYPADPGYSPEAGYPV